MHAVLGTRFGGTAILSRLPIRSAEHVLHEDLLMTTCVCVPDLSDLDQLTCKFSVFTLYRRAAIELP